MSHTEFSLEEVRSILKKEYGIQCKELKQLSGYLDKNYWIKSGTKTEYILRVTFSENFIGEDAADEIDFVKQHLHDNGFNIPHLIKTKQNCNRVTYQAECGKVRTLSEAKVQLSKFMPGKTVYESKLNSTELLEISFDVGQLLGLMTQCLTTYSCKKTTQFWKNDFFWYTNNFCQAKWLVKYVTDLDLKTIFISILEQFEKKVVPSLSKLRQGFVQGDLSNTNVVILKQGAGMSSLKDRLGIIDFDHCHYGPTVFELSVCMAYMMTSALKPETEAMLIARNVLLGYQEAFPLNQDEKDVLYLGVMARLMSSYAMASYQVTIQPENAEYVTVVSRKCPYLLNLLWKNGETLTMENWFEN